MFLFVNGVAFWTPAVHGAKCLMSGCKMHPAASSLVSKAGSCMFLTDAALQLFGSTHFFVGVLHHHDSK